MSVEIKRTPIFSDPDLEAEHSALHRRRTGVEDRERDSGMTFKEKLKKIIEKYGEDGQIAKALEELVELSEVLVKYLNKGELDRDHLIEEMADVDVMMAQLMIIFDIDTESYQDEIAKKIDRTLERMKQEPDCPWK